MSAYTAQDFANDTGVSRETLAQYTQWFNLLSKWNAKINLVSSATLDAFWHRHALDSYQLVSRLPKNTKSVLDMGAGAGFPGIAIAIEASGLDRRVTLCETNGKKANFLRTVIRELGLPAEVAQARIEALPKPAVPFDVITARAFASLTDLLAYSHRFWSENTVGIFPKGNQWENEIEKAQERFYFDYLAQNSQTEEGARILTITSLCKL